MSLEMLADQRRGVKAFFTNVRERLREVRSGYHGSNHSWVFYCSWGKHRSVALAYLLKRCMELEGANVRLRLCNTYRFAPHSCGRRACDKCDKPSDRTEDVVDRVYPTWRRARV